MIEVTDRGFGAPSLGPGVPAADLPDGAALTVDLGPADSPDLPLDRVGAIRVAFPSFADGRGFSLAAALRSQGFAGRLVASGHVLADQYRAARRAGFDAVEIDEDLAARQPEAQWLAFADWRGGDYRRRLGKRA